MLTQAMKCFTLVFGVINLPYNLKYGLVILICYVFRDVWLNLASSPPPPAIRNLPAFPFRFLWLVLIKTMVYFTLVLSPIKNVCSVLGTV